MIIKSPKGTHDILPSEIYKWQYIEKVIEELCRNFGYSEIRIPVFEHTELYARGVGDSTDIVQKEMYTFLDKGGRSITLRPEGTAGVVRSYIENGMASWPQPVKLYYNITAYRHENVQRGRYREFNQFGIELFGAAGASADAEVISMAHMLFERLGLKEISLNINSLGCVVCRKEYNKKLTDYFSPLAEQLCQDCQNRLKRNPLRILDCKEEICGQYIKDAPPLLDNLCSDCKSHFENVLMRLDNMKINYNIDKSIVRGLDYYNRTVFEFVSSNIGSQGTICGGGRYDNLVEMLGGPNVPGIGFALGIERLILEMENQDIEIPKYPGTDIYIAPIGNKADMYAEKLVYQLRKEGINAEKDIMERSLKAQMRYANKIGALYLIVLGDNEIENNSAVLLNMKTGEKQCISLDTIINRLNTLKNK